MFTLKNETTPDTLPAIFESVLGESPTQARCLGLKWLQQRELVRSLWSECTDVSLQASLDRSNKIVLEDEVPLQNFLQSNTKGTVLLTIHMGDYIHAILRILSLVSTRQVILLRKKGWTKAEQTMFGKLELIGHKVTTVRHGPAAAKVIVSALRQGAIVIFLYDLSSRWGETSPVRFFNTRLHWVAGPLLLAMLGRSFAIPFFTFRESNQWICEVNSVRDYTGDYLGNSIGKTAKRSSYLKSELQIITSLAEGYIRNHVSQWNHWHLIPEMASDESKETS
ncbi:MAG: hypothetical protein VB957_03370 [Pseudomonadales bacterium]|jgi:lauroyl/myristoyl acyltransferase